MILVRTTSTSLFLKLNSVLHGSLRDYPNLGIKKRPTSIRQYSLPCILRICQVFLPDFPQDILKWSEKYKDRDKITDSVQNVKRDPADPPCDPRSDPSGHRVWNGTQHSECQPEKSTENCPQKQTVVLSEDPYQQIQNCPHIQIGRASCRERVFRSV